MYATSYMRQPGKKLNDGDISDRHTTDAHMLEVVRHTLLHILFGRPPARSADH